MSSHQLAERWRGHPGYSRVYRPGHLTFGFIAPLESYPETVGPTMSDHDAMARLVDEAGFSAIWLRDVPFYDPRFGDVGQIFDPLAYAGYLAGITRRVTIGTAGLLLPLRDPLIVAKQVASVDRLSAGRFIMGVASGDRPSEYPAFGYDHATRSERFRDAFDLIQVALEQAWPVHQSRHFGKLGGDLDLVPKPLMGAVPAVVIGHAGQSLEWTATRADGILSYIADPRRVPEITAQWRALCGDTFKPYGYGTLFDLDSDPDAPLRPGRVLRAGRKALAELWQRQQEEGVSHVALHFKPQWRPAREVIEELAEYVLPLFPPQTTSDAPSSKLDAEVTA